MEELVRYMISKLVDNQDFSVELVQNGGKNEIKVVLPQEEMGKVIGRQGRIAKAIRTVVKAASARTKTDYSVEICERV